MINIREEKLRDGFTKFHLLGMPFDAVIHKLTPEDFDQIHDHPFAFRSVILKGSYKERVYYKLNNVWLYNDVVHEEGSSHTVEAKHIHEIIALPDEECWTLILPEEKVRDWGFWKFDETGAYFRLFNSENWIKQ